MSLLRLRLLRSSLLFLRSPSLLVAKFSRVHLLYSTTGLRTSPYWVYADESTKNSPDSMSSSRKMSSGGGEYYRADGVRITHDPYAPGMAERYGKPGQTDNEGFDPYRDTVGPGIYGGSVQRDQLSRVVIGKQYQNHNPRPGPVYSGGGYAPIAEALRGGPNLVSLLQKHPDLVGDITTGGAQPLHMCGMGKEDQKSTKILIQHGADIEALDTYGMTPLHRMASNNLAIGAKLLLEAGADPSFGGQINSSPADVGSGSRANDFLKVLKEYEKKPQPQTNNISEIRIDNAEVVYTSQGAAQNQGKASRELQEVGLINGRYVKQAANEIPGSFITVCKQNNWDPLKMWKQLNGENNDLSKPSCQWYKHTENDSYVYLNKGDGKWWIDGPSGLGVFIAPVYQSNGNAKTAIPAHGWQFLGQSSKDVVVLPPLVRVFRNVTGWGGKDEL